MNDTILGRIERWYQSNCNGDWEHDWRIRISTLDNPGWSVWINLQDTYEEPIAMESLEVERSDSDWWRCWLKGSVFEAVGGTGNLGEILQHFADWIERYSGRSVHQA